LYEEECTPIMDDVMTGSESAWAEGIRYNEKGNWATYFTYQLEEVFVFLEEVRVNSANINGNTTTNILLEGKQYKFVASGTWQNSNLNTLDAECRLNSGATDWNISAPRSLRLQVNDNWFPWGTTCAPDHIYTAPFVGLGETVKFRIADGDPPVPGWYADNVGSLTVRIYEQVI
jgi:hypothetical protein